jgi:uncharacterized protein
MATKIFVNLPVQDLEKSKDFFGKLGYSFNPQFTDEAAACMVIADDIYAMLLTHPRFKDFTPKAVANAHQSTEVLVALSLDSRTAVDDMVARAIAAGGTEARHAEDLGFMYSRSYNDLDGHIWEVFWMDENGFSQA